MIAQELEVSLHMAFVEARQARHEFITVEHLLLALLDNPSAAEAMRACACNIEDLRKSLQNFVSDNTPVLPQSSEADTNPTLGFQRVIQRAIMHVQSTSGGKKEVTGANVLVAIFGEKDSHAVYYLHQQDVTRLDVVNYTSHGITKVPRAESGAHAAEGREQTSPMEPYTPMEPYAHGLDRLADALRLLAGDEQTIPKVRQALEALEQADPRLAQVVQMHYLRGYNEREIAERLGVTERAVQRDWNRARLLLRRRIGNCMFYAQNRHEVLLDCIAWRMHGLG
jgi:ATP-dependent Clp protease ATP-binding subunit ClpA